jgi:hypothetical protein
LSLKRDSFLRSKNHIARVLKVIKVVHHQIVKPAGVRMEENIVELFRFPRKVSYGCHTATRLGLGLVFDSASIDPGDTLHFVSSCM